MSTIADERKQLNWNQKIRFIARKLNWTYTRLWFTHIQQALQDVRICALPHKSLRYTGNMIRVIPACMEWRPCYLSFPPSVLYDGFNYIAQNTNFTELFILLKIYQLEHSAVSYTLPRLQFRLHENLNLWCSEFALFVFAPGTCRGLRLSLCFEFHCKCCH